MSNEKNTKYSISFFSFLVMIFLTVYGLPNGEQVYYQMGYAAITYLVIAVIIFFIPYSFIVAEMSSAFKHKKGGIFSWMSESVNEGFSLVGTFIWYGSFVVMWFSASSICIAISVAIFGVDTTSTWHFLGFNAPETLAIVGAIYMIVAALITTRGLKRLSFLSNISIVTVIVSHILILGGGILLFALSGFKPAQGFDFTNIHSYFYGPNPSYSSFLPALGFLVFAVCIFAGMENSGGLVDQVKNGKKNVPRAIFVATVLITVLYIGTVLILGFICNWNATFSSSKVNLANFSIYIVQQEFFRLGTLLGLSPSQALGLGEWINRITTIIGLIGLTSIPLRLYTPIKHMFEGLPKGMLPEKLQKVNKHGMPVYAILLQTVIVVFFVLLLGFGGGNVSELFNKMTLMTFVASTVPISFVVFAYIKFKMNDNIKKEYTFFSKKAGVIFASVCFVVVTFVNIYSMIEPALAGNVSNSLWVAGGPVFFGLIAFILYRRYKRRKAKGLISDEVDITEVDIIE
ncbi:MAG: glutamate/gamma-aminobutyrate family transporter YjeM [Clostridium sp.]